MKKFAFTLQETLIVIAILGIVAVLIVPSIINKQKETAKRTKIKKAMSVYENAIQNICVTNRIKSKTELVNHINENDCKNVSQYFKVTQKEGCKFKTSDGIWWDVENADRAMIAFKEADLKSEKAKDFDDKDAFILVTSFDNQGILRVDDLSYETSNPVDYSDVYVQKLYNVLGIADEPTNFKKCGAKGQTTCTIKVDGKDITYNLKTIESHKVCFQYGVYDREIGQKDYSYCSETKGGNVWVSEGYAQVDNKYLKNEDGSNNCENSVYSKCENNGDYYEAIKRQCAAQGGRLGNVAEIGALYKTNQLPSSSGYYWTSDEYSSDRAYFAVKDGTTGGGSGGEKYYVSDRKFVCIGNE